MRLKKNKEKLEVNKSSEWVDAVQENIDSISGNSLEKQELAKKSTLDEISKEELRKEFFKQISGIEKQHQYDVFESFTHEEMEEYYNNLVLSITEGTITEKTAAVNEVMLNNLEELRNLDKSSYNVDSGEVLTDAIINRIISLKPMTEEELKKDFMIPKQIKDVLGKEIIESNFELLTFFNDSHSDKTKVNQELSLILQNLLYRSYDLSKTNPNIVFKNKDKFYDSSNFVQEDFLPFIESSLNNQTTENADDIFFTVNKNSKDLERFYESQENNVNWYKKNNLYISFLHCDFSFKEFKKSINFSAPLIFIPVKLTPTLEGVEVRFDTSRQINFNKEVFLLRNKFLEENTDLNIDQFYDALYKEEELNEKIKSLIGFFNKEGLDLPSSFAWKATTPFKQIQTFPVNKYGLNQYSLMGEFKVYHKEMTGELASIVSKPYIKNSLNNIFSVTNTIEEENKKETTDEEGKVDDSVSNIDLINKSGNQLTELNFSQLKAQTIAKEGNAVIKGPPGTGKTETIASIIVDGIINNKKILVVAEKEIALKVLTSRIGHLSKYITSIVDIKSPTSFFRKLEHSISDALLEDKRNKEDGTKRSEEAIADSIKKINENIYNKYESLNSIHTGLTSVIYGEKLGTLLQNHSTRTQKTNIYDVLLDSKIIDIFEKEKFDMSQYEALQIYNQELSHESNLAAYETIYNIFLKYPFFKETAFVEKHLLFKALRYFKNMDFKSISKFSMSEKKLIKSLFGSKKEIAMKALGLDFDKFVSNLDTFIKSYELITSLDDLTSTKKEWIDLIFTIKTVDPKNENPSQEIFDFLINEKIDTYLASNKDFREKILEASELRSKIKKLNNNLLMEVVELAELKLVNNIANNINIQGRINGVLTEVETGMNDPINILLQKYWKEIFSSFNVWMLTPEELTATIPFEEDIFDELIIDEASQFRIEDAIPALYRSKKFTFIGDEHQLKPDTITSNRIEFYFDKYKQKNKDYVFPPASLLDSVKNRYNWVYLEYHYRSVYDELIAFSNKFIYRDNLVAISSKLSDEKNRPFEYHAVKAGKMNLDGSNPKEAKQVANKVAELISEDPKKSIGVITFTLEQAEAIQANIDELRLTNTDLDLYIRSNESELSSEDRSLFIKPINQVQGDERDIILFSLTFSKPKKDEKDIKYGMISSDTGINMINVGFTRAKLKNIIIASIVAGDLRPSKNDFGGHALKNFVYYAMAVSDNNEVIIKNLLSNNKIEYKNKSFESRMHKDLYEVLLSEGYDVEYKYGLNKYKIDFLIRNKDGQPLLAIQTDNQDYLNNTNCLERDFYINRFLEARGWPILNIWAYEWREARQTVMAKIYEVLKPNSQSLDSGLNNNNTLIKDLDVNDFDLEVSMSSIDEMSSIIDEFMKNEVPSNDVAALDKIKEENNGTVEFNLNNIDLEKTMELNPSNLKDIKDKDVFDVSREPKKEEKSKELNIDTQLQHDLIDLTNEFKVIKSKKTKKEDKLKELTSEIKIYRDKNNSNKKLKIKKI